MSFFIDAHCHPTLKHYLFGRDVFGLQNGNPDFDYENIQVTCPAMDIAGVNVVLTAHYLPEKYIAKDWKSVELVHIFFRKLIKKYYEKLEKDNAFAQTLDMIDEFDHLFDATHPDAVVARSFQQMKEAIANGKKVFVHTLEGGHHLGRDLTPEQYSANIDALKQKGVAMITLLHWYHNNITTPTEGIPPGSKKILGMRYSPPFGSELEKPGEHIVQQLLQKGVLIDLTHTNPVARKQIYDINRQNGNKPLVFSHVGVRALFNDERNPQFALMAPDDEEILEIKKCNGVIGVIFMNYWLTGIEDQLLNKRNYGFDYIVDTIQYIARITGSFDHISIGTDFDGMADPPDDYYDCSMLGNFRSKLLTQFTEEQVDKITGGNMMRVLEHTWGQA